MRRLRTLLLAACALFALSLLAGRFIPVASTLMLGRWLTFQPVERQWIAMDSIAPALARAVIASEDQRFCTHWGVDFVELAAVLRDRDGPSRGASTLSMQVAKNVYLWPGRSYLRKALELPLALLIDLAWGKRRMMEIYLNVAEWGDGLFGAEAAARAYFGKSARHLSAVEAARLAAALPNPIERDAGAASAASRRILHRMAEAGPLTTCLEP